MQNWIANYILREVTGIDESHIWNNIVPTRFEQDLEFDDFKLAAI
jgi:hypothetical protein